MSKAKKEEAPRDISIADLIGLFAPGSQTPTGNPPTAEVEPSEPAVAPSAVAVPMAAIIAPPPPPPEVKSQITVATPEEMNAIVELAESAAELHDKIQELTGNLVNELGTKKKELLAKLLAHGIKKVPVYGRPPLELTIKSSKSVTKKSIVGVLGVDQGNELWNKLPVSSSEYITIPPKEISPEG